MAKVGRPKIKLTDLPDGWKNIIIDNKREGASDVEIRCELDISYDTWERLIEEEPEFSQTVKRGHELCEAWWVGKGRKSLENKDFSYVGWYMNMKNRFGWRDRRDTNVTGNFNISKVLDDLDD